MVFLENWVGHILVIRYLRIHKFVFIIIIIGVVREVAIRHFRKRWTDRKSKLSSETLKMMRIRHKTQEEALSHPRSLNKKVQSLMRRDLRSWNTRLIQEAIERNRGAFFTKTLGRSHLTKLSTSDGKTVTSVSRILVEIEECYGNLYTSHSQKLWLHASNPEPHLPAALRMISQTWMSMKSRWLSNSFWGWWKTYPRGVEKVMKLRNYQWDYPEGIEQRCNGAVLLERIQNASQNYRSITLLSHTSINCLRKHPF